MHSYMTLQWKTKSQAVHVQTKFSKKYNMYTDSLAQQGSPDGNPKTTKESYIKTYNNHTKSHTAHKPPPSFCSMLRGEGKMHASR